MDGTPYRSRAASAPPPPPPPPPPLAPRGRPAAIVVFGILNLVFGTLGVCGTAASSAMLFIDIPRNPAIPNPALDLIQSNATYRLFVQVMMTLGTIFAVVLVVAGIGLLLSKAWGRTLSIVYGWYAILGIIIGMIAHWVFLMQPLLVDMWQADGNSGPNTAAFVGIFGGLVGGCLGLIYPVILLVFMYRPALRDALAGRAR